MAVLAAKNPGERLVADPPTQEGAERVGHLVQSHIDFIWRSLRRLGVPEGDLADAAQQVFLVATRKLKSIRVDSERPFLFQTAVRVASTVRRTERRRREVGDEYLPLAADPRLQPDELTEERHRRMMLDEVLGAMPIDLRATFILIELEELTMAEAAALLGIPAGTVASRLRRARARFALEVQNLRAREGV